MYFQVIICVIVVNFVVIPSEAFSNIYEENNSKNFHRNTNMAHRNTLISSHNITYIDKAENMVRMPALNKYLDEHKARGKTIKKSPKSTIQKIIKKNKTKTKKLYFHQITSHPTQPPVKVEYDNIYAQEESQWKDDSPTTQVTQKKRPRKWNPKIARYPMPFQKLQRKDSHKFKRSADQDDVMIINDLDEIEFLDSKDSDYNIVNAHIQKNW